MPLAAVSGRSNDRRAGYTPWTLPGIHIMLVDHEKQLSALLSVCYSAPGLVVVENMLREQGVWVPFVEAGGASLSASARGIIYCVVHLFVEVEFGRGVHPIVRAG